MKRFIITMLALMGAIACTHNQLDGVSDSKLNIPKILTANFENSDSRIQLQSGKTVWNEGDCISVFYKSFDNLKWQFQGNDGDRSGDFLMIDGTIGSQTMNNTMVAYPYNTSYRINMQKLTLDATLPATQHYNYESYGIGDNLMVANCEFTSFTMMNVCGWLKIQLTGDGEKVSRLKLRGNNNEQIAGLIHVSCENASSILSSDDSNNDNGSDVGGNLIFDNSIITEVTLDCGEGVTLSANPIAFYIAIPPRDFENGITLEVETTNLNSMIISTANKITIYRNHILPMSVIEYEKEEIEETPEGSTRVTIAEFLNADEDSTLYLLTGEITSVTNTKYGNFYITDSTGSVYVYGLLTPEGAEKTQWSAAGLKQGDSITIYGTRSSYNGNPQMKNAIYVSHIPYTDDNSENDSETPTIPTDNKYASDPIFVCSSSDTLNLSYSLDSINSNTQTTIDGEVVTGFKLGTTNYTGVFTSEAVGVSGDFYLNFYAVAWKDKAATLYFKVDNDQVYSQELVANSGATTTPPYSGLKLADSDHYSFKLTGLKSSSKISFSTSPYFDTTDTTNTRAIVCGVKLSDKPLGTENSGNNSDSKDDDINQQTPVASNTWLELPAIRTDGAYPNASEYVIMASGERNYTHYYDTSTYASLWVAYPLASRHLGSYNRPSSWSYNPLISTSDQINLCNRSYTDTDTYSRGHLIPNASRDGILEMQLQTFYVTNAVPQVQNRFNGGVWVDLENAVRAEIGSDEIYVVTGVAFHKRGGSESIKYTTAKDDNRKIPIPNYFYKVILKVQKSGNSISSASTIGFWFENKEYNDDYTNYAVSVDTIEEWTGFDFFVNLPNNIEQSAESNTSLSSFSNFN